MSLENARPQFLQTVGDRRPPQVRTGNVIAEIEQDFSYPAHSDATDPYEMDVLVFFIHNLIARSTTLAAACGRASVLLASAIRFNCCGSRISHNISCARRSGVNSTCRIMRPAPAFSTASAFLR